MKFADFVRFDSIRTDMAATQKVDAITELVQGLVDRGHLKAEERESIVQAIVNREELGSTGIGRGVAVPHTKHSSVTELVGTVGISPDGVEFQSLDGDSVRLFFMLISPPDRPSDHLRALESIAKQLQDETFCSFLKQSKAPIDVQQLLEEADNNQFIP